VGAGGLVRVAPEQQAALLGCAAEVGEQEVILVLGADAAYVGVAAGGNANGRLLVVVGCAVSLAWRAPS
jgi:hypothetical protein